MNVHRITPNPLKYFGVEYSLETNSIHAMTLDSIIANNLKNLNNGYSCDYLLVGLLPSRPIADWFIEQFNITIRPVAEQARRTNNWQSIKPLIEELLQRAIANDPAQT